MLLRRIRQTQRKKRLGPAHSGVQGRSTGVMITGSVRFKCGWWVLGPGWAAAGCAQEPPEAFEAPRCVQVRCESRAKRACAASSAELWIELSEPLVPSGAKKSSIAMLPWERDPEIPGCERNEDCEVQARCLRGQCWSSPSRVTELRRWFRGDAGLTGSLAGWSLHSLGEALRLQTSVASEEAGLWAVYLGADWVTRAGHAPGASLRPFAFVVVEGHGKGRWSEVRPQVHEEGLEIAVPQGWAPQESWRWSLHCSGARPQPLVVDSRGPQAIRGRVVGELGETAGSCRVLVKVPGHAALATDWFSYGKDLLRPQARGDDA